MISWTIRHWKLIVAFISGIFAALFFVGFTHLSFSLTGTNEFCGRCHEMRPQVATWKMSSHSVNTRGIVADCVDCHLPPRGIRHYTYKAYSGLRDVIVHYLGDPESVDWEGKKFTKEHYLFQDACRSCHQDLTPPGMDRGGFLAHREWKNGRTTKRCWECHELMVHHNTPVLYSTVGNAKTGVD
jgi:cytochrome c nitrite reductase small subunit